MTSSIETSEIEEIIQEVDKINFIYLTLR